MPRCLFVLQDAWHRRSTDRHPHDVSGAVADLTIRDEDQLAAVSSPCRVDRVIEWTVVVAGDGAAPIRHHRTQRLQSVLANVGHVEQEVAGLCGRNEGQAIAGWRPPRLDVDRAIGGQGAHRARRQVEQHQLHRLAVVAHERDASAVRRAIRLIVARAIVSQLLGVRAVDPLPPQVPLHRVDQRRPIGRPGNR